MSMGIELMMKSFGIDPEAIKNLAGDFQKAFQQIQIDIADIKTQNEIIIAKLSAEENTTHNAPIRAISHG